MQTKDYRLINVGEIHHFHGRNFSRAAGPETWFGKGSDRDQEWLDEQCKLVAESFLVLDDGWLPEKPISVTEITEEADYAQAIEERTARIESIENLDEITIKLPQDVNGQRKVTVSRVELIHAYQEMFAPNGKPSKPKYDGVDGFRRTFVLPLANAARTKLGLPAITQIPVIIRKFADESHRATVCTLENTTQDTGRRAMSDGDTLRAAERIVRESSESRSADSLLQKAGFKRGMAQKYSAILDIDSFNPDARVVEFLKKNSGNISAIRWQPLREFIKEEASAAEIIEYLKNPKDGNPERQKAASARDMSDAAKNSPNKVVKACLNAAAGNTLGDLKALTIEHRRFNVAFDAIMGGSHPEVLDAINAVIESQNAELETA